MKVIAISNQKGGVAKTTTAVNLVAGLNKRGFKVLGIDLDPQGNFSTVFKAEAGEEDITIYEVLKREYQASVAVQQLECGVDFLPANICLASAERELNSEIGREFRLREAIASLKESFEYEYDYVVIDTAPSLGLLTVNALVAADEVLIPVNAGTFAVRGITQLNDSINTVRAYCNKDLKINGILFTKYDPRTRFAREIQDITSALGEQFSASVYKTHIRSTIQVEEAHAARESIFDHAPNATAAMDYNSFVDEFLAKEKEGNNNG